MIIAKQQIMDMISSLPEQIDVEELMYRFYLWEKLKSAEEDVSADRLLSHEEVVEETSQWFK